MIASGPRKDKQIKINRPAFTYAGIIFFHSEAPYLSLFYGKNHLLRL